MSRLVLLLALLASGCLHWPGPHGSPVGPELVAVDAARAAWTEARGPALGDQCAREVELVTVTAFSSPCRAGRDAAPACFLYAQPWVGSPWIVAIYLRDDLGAAARRYGIAHEMLHHLRECTTRDPDAEHLDLELWGPVLDAAVAGANRRIAP